MHSAQLFSMPTRKSHMQATSAKRATTVNFEFFHSSPVRRLLFYAISTSAHVLLGPYTMKSLNGQERLIYPFPVENAIPYTLVNYDVVSSQQQSCISALYHMHSPSPPHYVLILCSPQPQSLSYAYCFPCMLVTAPWNCTNNINQ